MKSQKEEDHQSNMDSVVSDADENSMLQDWVAKTVSGVQVNCQQSCRSLNAKIIQTHGIIKSARDMLTKDIDTLRTEVDKELRQLKQDLTVEVTEIIRKEIRQEMRKCLRDARITLLHEDTAVPAKSSKLSINDGSQGTVNSPMTSTPITTPKQSVNPLDRAEKEIENNTDNTSVGTVISKATVFKDLSEEWQGKLRKYQVESVGNNEALNPVQLSLFNYFFNKHAKDALTDDVAQMCISEGARANVWERHFVPTGVKGSFDGYILQKLRNTKKNAIKKQKKALQESMELKLTQHVSSRMEEPVPEPSAHVVISSDELAAANAAETLQEILNTGILNKDN